MRGLGRKLWALAAVVGLVTVQSPLLSQAGRGPADVDGARIRAADREPGNWYSYGRDWREQRYSPLAKINDGNAGRLGLAWYIDLKTNRGMQATPLVIDGVLYNASVFNAVTAYDAKTGKPLWTFDPQVERQWARLACCGPSTRGIAAWKGKIYIAALDGRLIAVNARTGKQLWSVKTFENKDAYSITGPPRVFDGKVVIGNAGADYGVRGFVSAYDAETGAKLWKFFLVPGNPAEGPDGEASDPQMAMATKTWTGEWWKYGGGGTAWDSIVYDPDLDTVYVGTGNGSPHVQHFRSPGGGDNLFLCSIVALDATSGRYKWHYQMVPGEEWDFTCTQPMILADLKIAGRDRKVLMQAPKNGFFYVLDRKSGKLISAKSYVPNTWATSIDMKTGRPVETSTARFDETLRLMTPSHMAAHTWHPMAYSPKTGLVYLSAQEQTAIYARVPDQDFRFVPFRSNSGLSWAGGDPALRKRLQVQADAAEKGYLLAWNPATQSEAFRIPYPSPGSGGVLATAGNLLFQGTIEKNFAAYRADNGRKLWEMPVQNVGIAGPMTYEVDGEQYVAVNVGWGNSPVASIDKAGGLKVSQARLLVFKLGGTAQLPPMPPPAALPRPPWLRATEAQVRDGARLYADTCSTCHGEEARGGVKDLRFMTAETHAQFDAIVFGGIRASQGMASFKDLITKAQGDAIHAYLIARGNEDYAEAVAQ